MAQNPTLSFLTKRRISFAQLTKLRFFGESLRMTVRHSLGISPHSTRLSEADFFRPKLNLYAIELRCVLVDDPALGGFGQAIQAAGYIVARIGPGRRG
jgi:hypothetical protein